MYVPKKSSCCVSIMEGTLELCHLCLVLWLDMLIALGEGDKALKCLHNYVTESTIRESIKSAIIMKHYGNFILTSMYVCLYACF